MLPNNIGTLNLIIVEAIEVKNLDLGIKTHVFNLDVLKSIPIEEKTMWISKTLQSHSFLQDIDA